MENRKRQLEQTPDGVQKIPRFDIPQMRNNLDKMMKEYEKMMGRRGLQKDNLFERMAQNLRPQFPWNLPQYLFEDLPFHGNYWVTAFQPGDTFHHGFYMIQKKF